MESPMSSSNTILNKLKSMTRNVIAIKKLEKNIEAYNVEGNSERNILCLTEFDNKAHIKVSNKWAKILKMKPHIMDALVELTEESNKNVEELDGDQENNANPIVSMNQDVHLPKMFAPFKDKKQGWNDQNVMEELVL